jgi:membrane-associated phospholipid phosphatase
MSYTPGTNPGDWQPTPPAFLPAALPQWGLVTPFCLQSGSQFRPPPPPALTSAEYTAAFNQIKDLGSIDSTTRTPDQTEASIFWQGVYASPNCYLTMLNQIARQVAETRGNSLVDDARLFALLDLTLADSYIACWEAKYTYNFWRPVTAIRAADSDGNPDTEADPNWTPLMATPNFPSYPSGHSSVIGGSAAILAAFFGTDAIPFSVSYPGLPGVTRSYDSFTSAANECGLSRIWVGFHWSFDVSAGLAQGQSVGSYVYQNFLLPRTSPPPGGSAAPILVAPRGFSAAEQTEPLMFSGLLQGGFRLPADGATAGLPVEQPIMNPVPADTAGSKVVVDSGFGEDAISFSVSDASLRGVTRSYDSFTAAANEHWMNDPTDVK